MSRPTRGSRTGSGWSSSTWRKGPTHPLDPYLPVCLVVKDAVVGDGGVEW